MVWKETGRRLFQPEQKLDQISDCLGPEGALENIIRDKVISAQVTSKRKAGEIAQVTEVKPRLKKLRMSLNN